MSTTEAALELEPQASGSTMSIVTRLLSIRAAETTAGNRRRLYAAIDGILETMTDFSSAIDPAFGAREARNDGSIALRRVRLNNWKSFERAELRLPAGDGRRLMTVVNGQNGFGKSSILEAIAFGLFGRLAVTELGFLLDSTNGRGGRRRSYRTLVEQSLHRSPRARREGMAGVSLSFEGSEPVEIERRWYFDEDGRLIEEDEELLVRVGEDRHLLETPCGQDPREWYQSEIERRVIPADLAPFFLFDGEQVERWAERRLSDQVRLAISRVLGLSDLTGLADDLRDYARDRERRFAGADAGMLESLLVEVESTERELGAHLERQEKLDEELAVVRMERDAMLSSLAANAGASHADLQPLLEDEHRLQAELARAERELVGTMADVGPAVMMSGRLLGSLSETLAAEATDERAAGFDPSDFDAFWERVLLTEPILEEAAAVDIRRRLLRAWSGAEEKVQDERTHRHLDRTLREAVLARVRGVPDMGRSRLTVALAALQDVRGRLTIVTETRARLAGHAERHETARARLALLAPRMDDLEHDRRTVAGRVMELEAALAERRGRLDHRMGEARMSEPRLRAAGAARLLATQIDEHLRTATVDEHENFAAAVTESFCALAHKGQISRISIATDGDVELFDAQGRDITDYRLSAGENQLFAMALIAAVGSLVGRRLPLFVDTPLGRLDTRHRGRVLSMLAKREGQTVLLTQPEEMTPRHVEAIRPVLAGIVDLVHVLDERSGVGVSTFAAAA